MTGWGFGVFFGNLGIFGVGLDLVGVYGDGLPGEGRGRAVRE